MRPEWRWTTLPWQAALGFVLLIGGVAVLLPQVIAVAIAAPDQFGGGRTISLADLVGLWGQPDPSAVTGSEWSGLIHWVIVVGFSLVVIAVVVLAAILRARHRKNPQHKKGLASIADVSRELSAKQLVQVRGPKLRPSMHPASISASDVGYRVGTFLGIDVWIRSEDPTIVIGPSRSGKGFFLVLNWIVSAPGAVITTSSKMDNALMTMMERERAGSRCWVFAPGIAGGKDLGHLLKWDPTEGCVDEETLVRRIKALIPGDSFAGSTSNGGHWDTLGQQLAAHLFHAAACAGFGVDRIWDWVSSPQRAMEAVRAIRDHEDGLPEHARHLETVINVPPEQRASQWGVLPTVLAFLESRAAREWMTPDDATRFDIVDFVLQRETLYLVGDKQTTGGYVRIIDGLLAELDYVSKGLADASPGARLDPPISYILDEAGNFEYQGLYELITAGGGRGRVAFAVFQSKEQLAQWGAENAATMWDAAVAKIVLPGGANEDELAQISRLIGELWEHRESHSWGGGPSSIQVSREERAILKPREIREMEGGYCLLFYRNLKAVIPKMMPFSKNPAYGRCAADAERLSAGIRNASPFASRIRDAEAARRA